MASCLIWRIGDFADNRQIKNPPILFHTLLHYAEALAITKFKIRQRILMTDLPNLMLAKVSCYTVYTIHIPIIILTPRCHPQYAYML